MYGKDSNVFKFTYPSSVDLQFYPTQGSVAQADADALELSFDFKFDESIGTGVYRIFFHNGANTIGIMIGVEDGKLYIKDTRQNSVTVNTDANPYEWNNLRFVIVDMYSTSYQTTTPRLRVYVNNDTDKPTKTIDFNNSNTKFSLVDTLLYFQTRFANHESGTHPIAYFDNVWCGFLAD